MLSSLSNVADSRQTSIQFRTLVFLHTVQNLGVPNTAAANNKQLVEGLKCSVLGHFILSSRQ